MRSRCPSFEVVSRLASGEEVPELEAHLRTCARCTKTLAALRSLQEAARALEVPAPPPGWAERVERELRAPGPRAQRRPARTWIVGAAALAAAAAAGGFLVHLVARPPDTLARVAASPEARLRHVTVHPLAPGEPVVERVELESGLVTLRVAHLGEGERMIVATRDAEVEVRGTEFDVAAEDGLLRSVLVRSGVVEVRHRDAPPVWLHAGGRWVAPPSLPAAPATPPATATDGPAAPRPRAIAAAAPRVASPAPAEPPPPAPVPDPAPAGSPAEQAFTEGWEALTSGKPGRAVDRFARAADGAGDAGLREDARYWRIVALQRLGESAAAIREAAAFLESWPSSLRAGELSLLVGADRLASGDRAGARRLLERAAQDPSPSVRERAREGLEALAGPH